MSSATVILREEHLVGSAFDVSLMRTLCTGLQICCRGWMNGRKIKVGERSRARSCGLRRFPFRGLQLLAVRIITDTGLAYSSNNLIALVV